MINPFRKGILFGTVVTAVATVVCIVSVFVLITAYVTTADTQKYLAKHLEELLDTVESTAGVACFVEDKQLAADLAAGLLKNAGIASVTVKAGNKELVHANNKQLTEADLARDQSFHIISRKINSPFSNGQVIGEIIIQQDISAIDQQVSKKVRFTITMLAIQLILVAAAVVFILYYVVVRPIRSLSINLRSIDPAAGEQLHLPEGHEGNEIAGLTDDINKLTATLVHALSNEKHLRIEREIDEKKFSSIFENAGSGIFIADNAGNILSFNRSFIRLTNFPKVEAGHSHKLSHIAWNDFDLLEEMIVECLKSRTDQALDLELDTKPACWLNLVLTAIADEQVQGVLSDVTQGKQLEAAALQMAVTDKLTGLSNRLGLERYLPDAIRHSRGESLAMMVIDLKGFKQINESMGLTAGDQVLKMTASRLLGCLKKSDWLARLGGDDFVVVIHGAARIAAESVSVRIAEVLRRPIEINDTTISSSCSIGIAFYPTDGTELQSLLRSAEFALHYAQKEGGRDYEFFTPSMVVAAEEKRKLESELVQAIQRDELRLFYQPIVDLKEGRIVGAESLIRWQHPTRGLVPPDSFIPVAEESQFICDIGLWVLETACRQLATWQAVGKDLYLSINVSARQIPDALPVSLLMQSILRYGIPASSLVLEITEGVLLSDIDKGLEWIKSLRDAGFRIYLDDFGTGYSSLSYLKRFPINVVKVDRSFIRDMDEQSSDRVLVQAIVAMAKALQMQVVAEGVENETQIAILKEMGCHYGQGYYFSKAVPARDFDLLKHEGLHLPG